MKKLIALITLCSLSVQAAGPEIDNLSKKDLKEVSNEIAVNFSHTAVAAPETNGVWGIEAGLVAGTTGTSKLEELVDEAGEDGSDFKRTPHAGLMLRAHFPFELFAEMTFIPGTEISDLEISNRTFAIGWNFGSQFQWPLDVALGAQMSNSELSFDQIINNTSTGNTNVNSTVSFESKTRSIWLGVSKTFAIVTPYAKVGTFSSESDVQVETSGGSGTIFAFSNDQKENVTSYGGFGAVGVNVNLLVLRLGFEASRAAEVGRVTGKLSFAF